MMEANNYISKLKANGNAKDYHDLASAHKEYKNITLSLPPKDRDLFSLNVICILCRNLEKVQTWRDRIDDKLLLTLSIDCIRETRGMNRQDRLKTLASIYYIHKHVIKQNTNAPPELVLKISYMAFEHDTGNLLTEHHKTYWNILADRLNYLEKLKTKVSITKLMNKLTEDILKLTEIYDTVQFCMNVLSYLVKKLHSLYNQNDFVELNKLYLNLFEGMSKKSDLNAFNRLPEKELLDVYFKLNDCFYVIAENASKNDFRDAKLEIIVRCIISLVGQDRTLFNLIQTFYMNSFCCILTENIDEVYAERILESILRSFEATERLGYNNALNVTYPFLNQLLRLFIEKHESVNVNTQEKALKLILYLMGKLGHTKQFLKCENCKSATGWHDALKLSFQVKNILSASLSRQLDVRTILPIIYQIIKEQYAVLNRLIQLKCVNGMKFFRKLQTDVHNLAINLNKESYNEQSVKLFSVYLKYEIAYYSNEADSKNISRALYNKSICEMDSKMYDEALTDAYLSLIFNLSDKQTDKHMNLVMDIKAKAAKAIDDEALQLRSVLEACKVAVEKELYGNIRAFFVGVKFSEILQHEFSMYAKQWPSMVPVAGVWTSLWDLLQGRHPWTHAEQESVYKWALYDVMLQTPDHVRSLHCKHYRRVVNIVIDYMDRNGTKEVDEKIVYVTLLFLKSEIDLCEASEVHGWRAGEANSDPDKVQYTRTLKQEHDATRPALRAVPLWGDLAPHLDRAGGGRAGAALRVAGALVQQLLLLDYSAHALQLARACCAAARSLDDREAFIRNAGVLLYHMETESEELNSLLSVGSSWCRGLDPELVLTFLCEAAIHYTRRGAAGAAARLLRVAQARALASAEKRPGAISDLAVGRLLEAQHLLCKGAGPSLMTALNAIQRHYLAAPHLGSGWCARKQYGLCLRWSAVRANVQALTAPPDPRRHHPAAVPHPATAAATMYAALAHTLTPDEAQVQIDNRLKNILGLQPTTELQPSHGREAVKAAHVPQDLETMLDCRTFKRTQTSPGVPCLSVPAFKMPEYFHHDPACDCFACSKPSTLVLACKTAGLEASVYFRSKEYDIAENYFKGALDMIRIAESKRPGADCERFIAEDQSRKHLRQLRQVHVEVLVELCYLELARGRIAPADDCIVAIYETTRDHQCDPYTHSEVLNLVAAAATLRGTATPAPRTPRTLDEDFEMLKLSEEDVRTPVTKRLPDNPKKIAVKDEDVMKVRKVIKLDLDSADEEPKRKPEFKIPTRVTSKPALEDVTPRPRRPRLVVQQPSVEVATPAVTPKREEFLTPATPEQFFTPMTSIKTYSKRNLRGDIVKNLEKEFSTPVGKENAKSKGARQLRRAVSPGKLRPDQPERPRRTRKPVLTDGK
ncbi:uncharacterized protein LOC114246173 [Bombyx mandarina]|uniref:Uncharacterized protein LOC114246173 n=1 Tax=Bombyx mandarina TaxID=7092 RepID=A0A6J2K251_BOMMA|nr:uncharacterized protein LOC114246173 [Bombyx mandarina]